MPGYTPHFGIPYPLLNEVVDAAVWQALSQAVDDQFTVADGLRQLNLHRPTANCTGGVNGVAPATTTAVTFNINNWCVPSSFHSTVTNTEQFIIPTAGLYFIGAVINTAFNPTTLTSVTASITQNAVAQYTASQSSSGISALTQCAVKGLIACSVGDVLRIGARWTGTGTANLRGDVQMFMLAAL